MVSDWPVVPSSTSWWATSPRSRTEWMRIPAGPSPPRAPASVCDFVGSGVHSVDVSAIRWAVNRAVPEGASALLSWCSSMISADSNQGAAMAASCIMRTAPMAKLGAITALARSPSNRAEKSWRSLAVRPVVPTTACTPLSPHHRRLPRAASTWVKSTATDGAAAFTAGPSIASVRPVPVTPKSSSGRPSWGGSMTATSSMSGASSTARHTVVPIRPAAPSTATRIFSSLIDCRPYRETVGQFVGGDRADGGQHPGPGGQDPVDDPGDVVGGDGVDGRHHGVDALDLAAGHLGPADALHAGRAALEPEGHLPLEVALGPLQLGGGQAPFSAEPVEFGVDDRQHLGGPLGGGAGVDG